MKIVDISWPLSENMTGYKNKKEFHIKKVRSLPQDSSDESMITLGSHAGTHIDAPGHMIPGASLTNSIALESLVGDAFVLDMTHCTDKISATDLENYFSNNAINIENKIVLFKTKNSFLASDALFDSSFVYIAQNAADYLVQRNIKAVGIDYLGIERNQKAHETHTIFMHAGITIIEGLRLHHASNKSYFCICLPLFIDADAAPARAILIDN